MRLSSVRQRPCYSFAHNLPVASSPTVNQRQNPYELGKALCALPTVSFLTSAPSSNTPGTMQPGLCVPCSFCSGLQSQPLTPPWLTLHSLLVSAQMSTSQQGLLAHPPSPSCLHVFTLSFSSSDHISLVMCPFCFSSLKDKLLGPGPYLFCFSAVSLVPRMVPSVWWGFDEYVLGE